MSLLGRRNPPWSRGYLAKSKSDLLILILLIGRQEMITKEEVVRRIEKLDEIRTILDDIRRSEMTELERIEDAMSLD